MISIRRARPTDAVAIGAVHVAAWRSAYPGILPDAYLARLSVARQAAYYDSAIRGSTGVYVATASGIDVPPGSGPRIIGYATAGRTRLSFQGWSSHGLSSQGLSPQASVAGRRLGEGEIETLYVLDDWRDRGIGRRLMRTAAAHLIEAGCKSAFLWVLRDNPSRWFYQRLGGRPIAESITDVAGNAVPQVAFVWEPIEKLLQASPQAS